VYLTRDRNKAAVWSWSRCPNRLDHFRPECPLSRLTVFMTSCNWLHAMKDPQFTLSNIESFQTLSFGADNTFDYRVHGGQNLQDYK
jgi:hypothetical protein